MERFANMMYGNYLSSYDLETPLVGICYCVGMADDEDGLEWRTFTESQWEQIKHLTNEEIYAKYQAAKPI